MELTNRNESDESIEIFYSDEEQSDSTGDITTMATMDWQNATNATVSMQNNLTMEIETERTDRTDELRLIEEITIGARDLVKRYFDKAEKLRQSHEIIQRLENLNDELMQEVAMACDRIDSLLLDQEMQDREMLDLSQQLGEYEEEIEKLTEERDKYRDEIGLLLRRLNWR